ncbi:Oidioi.mRNA.OKI2018_I69.chr1.g1331.t1.cds [Oikopleura dioica]|uniref:Oidioi.mRNA.OKI2018_I69.chr1.g1331.t1.cds n=1 Tax=Oikopleura dioica TaxID=34765 RepID=A0ABN7SMK3_OIKDI|nr:Oidioi.mRNA.OKI2018_I69.chr1.g1331.t1.cds [Oikopleura dioica]
MFEKLRKIFKNGKDREIDNDSGKSSKGNSGKRRQSLIERVRKSIIPDDMDLTFSSLKRASQLDTKRRSTRKTQETKHVTLSKQKVDQILDKEPRVSQYLKVEPCNRRKGSNSRIWAVSEQKDHDAKVRRQFKHVPIEENIQESSQSDSLRKISTSPALIRAQESRSSTRSLQNRIAEKVLRQIELVINKLCFIRYFFGKI